jgi:P27 family predicted phage terminase small subunit
MRGPRRHTLAEAKLSGPQAVRDHRRNYGIAPSAADVAPGDLGKQEPPAYLDAAGKAAWRRVIALAPPGLLRAGDGDLLATLAAAIARHERAVVISQNAWDQDDMIGAESALFFNIERHVRQTARQVSDLSTALGLSPPARSRLVVPYPPVVESEDVPRFQKFDTLLPDGKVLRYRPPSGTRKTRSVR